MSLLVFGSAVADLLFRMDRLPREGETLLGEAGAPLPGGKGLNQAIAAARDGAAVRFAGCVGTDANGSMLHGALDAAGVDTTLLAATGAGPSGLACVMVDAEGRNQIAVSPGANLQAGAVSCLPGETVLMQMEVRVEENLRQLRLARDAGAHAILNLAPALAFPRDALAALRLLVLNETEAAWLAAHLGCGTGAIALRAATSTDVAVTLAERGAEAATTEGLIQAGPFAVRVADTVGAGDAWCGVLAASLGRGLPLQAAMRRANAAAALACTRPGAAIAMPDAAQTDALLG
ncbi:PfkB family carbohydrate kinase [Sabulicella glaciei]|uniref:Ribokinase n=1 Tax=Sabulicella glaciei TaxID=2984948 RepID=A0ABT3P120_9PROT|nr:PfkB family carbohydrate kinase [Roseococcus sp. MDT2-1-1]MCW8087459.1 PfkB family carbohydrate kinase [Roseococcus sp. MDT2-1-1]